MKKPTKDEQDIIDFLEDWYASSLVVGDEWEEGGAPPYDVEVLRRFAAMFPYDGVAYRAPSQEGIHCPTSWSASFAGLSVFLGASKLKRVKVISARLRGALYMGKMARSVIHLTNAVEVSDIADVDEVVCLKTPTGVKVVQKGPLYGTTNEVVTQKGSLLCSFIDEALGQNFGTRGLARFVAPDNVRGSSGVDMSGHLASNTNDDFDNEQAAKKRAACCLIVAEDGKVLMVSRRDDPSKFSMPGGKVDTGESPIEAAGRELEEETGLVATALHPVYVGQDGPYEVTTFACEVEGGHVALDDIATDEEGLVRWGAPSVLLDVQTCPFVEYNKQLYTRLGYDV